MQRTRNIKYPDAILCGDLHLRDSVPICRTDDFISVQWKKMDFICELQQKFDCVVLCGGDVFDHWKPSPYLLAETIKHLPDKFYTVYGNHDLPQHSLNLADRCGVNVLKEAKILTVLEGVHFGQEVQKEKSNQYFAIKNRLILVWHYLTYITAPFPGATGGNAQVILRKYETPSLILTSDNHQSFYTTYEGRLLVNPGNLTRQTADQIDFQPRVALWYADTNTIEWVNLPMQEGVISREHIERTEQRDARIDAFVSKLNTEYETELSFEDNLEKFFAVNDVREPVKQIIYKCLES